MEQIRKNRIRNTIRTINKITITIGNFYRSLVNADFREFKNMEYATVVADDVTDLQKLRYIKRLELAKNGFINNDLKNLLAFLKEKSRLLNREIRVRSIGYVEFVENDTPHATIKLGYDQKDKHFKIAYSSYGNIPKWKNLDRKEMIGFISRIHPKTINNLTLRHEFLENESEGLEKQVRKRTIATYNVFVQASFEANKYVKKSILRASETILADSLKYIGKQFFLDMEPEKRKVMTLTDVNSEYLVFQSFLKTAPKPKTQYFTRQEFKSRFIDNQIERIAKLKFGLNLGAKDGILYIEQTNPDVSKSKKWSTFDEVLMSDSVSAKAKYYLSKMVITDKNFCVEKDAIILHSGLSKAYIKRHYRTGKWHFSEEKIVGQDMDFRPVTPEVLSLVQKKYCRAKNYAQVLKAFHRPKIKTTSKFQDYGQKV